MRTVMVRTRLACEGQTRGAMTEPMQHKEPAPEIPPEGSSDSRAWAVGAHLSPWVIGFLGPLFIWLAKKQDPYVEYHPRGALNYQLSLALYAFGWIVVGTTAFVALVVVGAGIVALIVFGLGFLALIYLGFVPPIIGAIRASNGDIYRYPVTIRFVRMPGQ
jgi:uncharacterized Tic20 family protein